LLFILGAQIRVRLGGLSLIADLIAWSTIYAADYHHDPAVPAGEVIAGCSSQTSSKAFWIASVYSAALSVVINLASQSPPSRRNSAAAVPFYADKSVLALTAASRRHFGAPRHPDGASSKRRGAPRHRPHRGPCGDRQARAAGSLFVKAGPVAFAVSLVTILVLVLAVLLDLGAN